MTTEALEVGDFGRFDPNALSKQHLSNTYCDQLSLQLYGGIVNTS